MNDTDFEPRFIGEPITVAYDKPPLVAKKPPCPNQFEWDGQTFRVETLLAEWRDYERRGRMASNMRPENARRATFRGSWGVGRYYFRVRVAGNRIFELYYDRAPKGQSQREGSWHLYRELYQQ